MVATLKPAPDAATMVATIEAYFDSVDRSDVAATLATMTADCVLEYRTAGKVYAGRDTGIRDYFVERNARVARSFHGNAQHTIDPVNARVATRFELRRLDHGAAEQTGDNLNLFEFDGALIKWISVWSGMAR